MSTLPHEIVSFWSDAGAKAWFRKSKAFDDEIAGRYRDEVLAARDGTLDDWMDDANSCLALLLLLDQFPRNIFRDTPDMFASDAKAIATAKIAVQRGHDQAIEPGLRAFVYMPFMHSETVADQATSVALFDQLGVADNIKHALEHAEIIEKFGRFPHRNAILGRASTSAEIAFLADGGFAG